MADNSGMCIRDLNSGPGWTWPDLWVKFFTSENPWVGSGCFEILMSIYGSKRVNSALYFQLLFRAYWWHVAKWNYKRGVQLRTTNRSLSYLNPKYLLKYLSMKFLICGPCGRLRFFSKGPCFGSDPDCLTADWVSLMWSDPTPQIEISDTYLAVLIVVDSNARNSSDYRKHY